MKNQTNDIPLTDIKIAAFLLSMGSSLTGVNRQSERKIVFLFEKTEKNTQLIQNYMSNKSLVNPRLLFESFANLKSIIFKEIQI